MLSYRHGFHAGNHADVFKHVVLSLILQSLGTKSKPYFYLDTHGGAGRYSLDSHFAQKNKEFESGISQLWNETLPELLQPYLSVLRSGNSSGKLKLYPGSPRLARQMLREQDRMVVCELHPSDYVSLGAEFKGDRQVKVEKQDGYGAIKALLPPLERRGLVHIDPSYELKGEWKKVLDALVEGHRRWATGIFAVWYPIQDQYASNQFLQRVTKTGIRKLFKAELSVLAPTDSLKLVGSGMLIINPPWQLEEQLKEVLPWLWDRLAVSEQGNWKVEWLAGE